MLWYVQAVAVTADCLILICSTVENTKMNDCYFEKRDWRQCKKEVRPISSSSSIRFERHSDLGSPTEAARQPPNKLYRKPEMTLTV